MKKTIILDAGHNIIDPGATVKTTTEAQEAIKIRDKLALLLKQNFEVAMVPDDLNLVQSINWVNERYKNLGDGLAFSIHLNAGGGEGAEIFYYANNKISMERAQVIIDKYCNLTRFRNRGAKPDTSSQYKDGLAWIRKVIPWSFLLECCFIDNDQELQRLQKEYDEIAWAIYCGICEVFNVKPIDPENNRTTEKQNNYESMPQPAVTVKIDTELPIFKKGEPNLAMDENTKAVREFINYEFKFDYKTVWLQCTEYVQYKVLKDLHIRIDWTNRIGPRNGADWSNQFTMLQRYKVSDVPKKGCAMSFRSGCPVPPGHVAYVEEVFDNDSIFISEANWPPPGQKERGHYNERKLTKDEWQNKYNAKFIDFT